MFPNSFAAVLGFLVVVAPGLVYEILRERKHPTADRSAFREASDVALASLICGTVALVVLAGIKARWPRLLPDAMPWIREGTNYVVDHLGLVRNFFVGWMLVALVSAWIGSVVLGRGSKVRIDPNTMGWFQVFREQKPPGTAPVALVSLDDESAYVGEVLYYDASQITAEREIVLGPPLWRRSNDHSALERLPPEHEWQRVVIPGARITALWVRYPWKSTPLR